MTSAWRRKVVIRKGGRIEITDPALPEGADAEVIVLFENATAPANGAPPLSSMIGSCRGLWGSTPEDADKALRALRDEWE